MASADFLARAEKQYATAIAYCDDLWEQLLDGKITQEAYRAARDVKLEAHKRVLRAKKEPLVAAKAVA